MTETKSTKATAGHYQAVMKDRLIFDSHEYVKRMTGGGFNEQQAEALATEQADLLNSLATRQDIETVKDDLEVVKDDLEVVKRDLETVKKNMATKDDLENMAIKYDLENMATKDDLKNLATKDEVENIAITYNLKNMATKQDIEMVRKEIVVSAQTLKVEMIKWMTWYFLSGLAVMIAVLKLT